MQCSGIQNRLLAKKNHTYSCSLSQPNGRYQCRSITEKCYHKLIFSSIEQMLWKVRFLVISFVKVY